MIVLKLILSVLALVSQIAMADVTQNWKAVDGYDVQVDSSGWSFPVAIQFVPSPQNSPKAPLYYVTELRGNIKVVTQDRTVYTYAAHIEALRPKEELPSLKGEFGTTGVCLHPEGQYLYVTTVYRKGGLLFNKMLRFKSAADGLSGVLDLEIVELFSQDRSSLSHQIGNCIIGKDQKLYVGVGDAHHHQTAQLLHHTTGKVLRLNLDGSAPTDNPFYEDENPDAIQNFVYAYGLRNPFAIAEADGAIYTADSGPSVDRLLKLIPGRNYLWDGTDASMLLNGIVTWSEPLGPAGMIWLKEHPRFPDWNNHLLVTGSVKAFIQAIWIDSELGAKAPPKTILKYTGDQEKEKQYIVPIAEGPDGIYFSGFLPQNDGETYILKIVPSKANSNKLDDKVLSGEGWYAHLGCAGCHQIGGKGGTLAPKLDNLVPRVFERLHDSAYEKQLDQVDQLTQSPFVDYQSHRDTLRGLEGMEKVRFWIETRLKEPQFDSPDSQMPNFQLTDEQITALTDYLIKSSPQDKKYQESKWKRWAHDLKFYFNTHLNLWLGTMFVLGLFFNRMLAIGWRLIQVLLKRR